MILQLLISLIGDAQLNFGSTNSVILFFIFFCGSSSVVVPNVLFVLEIKKHLLSVTQLTSEFSCIFEFSVVGFLIKEWRIGNILARENKKVGLCALDEKKKS